MRGLASITKRSKRDQSAIYIKPKFSRIVLRFWAILLSTAGMSTTVSMSFVLAAATMSMLLSRRVIVSGGVLVRLAVMMMATIIIIVVIIDVVPFAEYVAASGCRETLHPSIRLLAVLVDSAFRLAVGSLCSSSSVPSFFLCCGFDLR
jgi:hypothetical protein